MARKKQLFRNTVCLWLNTIELDTAIAITRDMRGCTRTLFIGPSFFLAHGPPGVRCLTELGMRDIVLDVRLIGTANEIWQSITAASQLGVKAITIHAMSGPETIKLAIEAAEASKQLTMRVQRPRILLSLLPASLDDAEIVDDLQLRVKRRGHVQQAARHALHTGADGVVAEFAQRGARNYAESISEEAMQKPGITEVLEAHATHVLFDANLVRLTNVEWASDMVTKEVQMAEGVFDGKLGDNLLSTALRNM